MRTTTMDSTLSVFLAMGLLLPGVGSTARGTDASPHDADSSLHQLQDRLDAQTRRIDRLYRLLGPHLEEMEQEAARVEKRQQEDERLALQSVRQVTDDTLTGIACMNPVEAEFAVITRDGGLRLFNEQAQAAGDLRSDGQQITCVAFSPGGSEVLAGSESGALLVWGAARDACITVCTNVGRKVDRVTWLGRDRVVWGGNVRYWQEGGVPANRDQPAGAVLDRVSGEQHWEFLGFIRHDFATLAGAANGGQLAVLEIPGQPRGAFLLEGQTGEVRRICYDKAHGAGPLSVGLSPDGGLLAVGYAPHDIILWNARTGDRLRLLEGHSNWVVSLAFSADGRRLISGAGDSTARIWDLDTGREMGRIRFSGESTYVEGVGLAPDGTIAFASAPGVLVVGRVGP